MVRHFAAGAHVVGVGRNVEAFRSEPARQQLGLSPVFEHTLRRGRDQALDLEHTIVHDFPPFRRLCCSQRLEPVERVGPMALLAHQPGSNRPERLASQVSARDATGARCAALIETGTLQHLQMARNGGSADLNGSAMSPTDNSPSRGEALHDGAPGRIGKCREYGIEPISEARSSSWLSASHCVFKMLYAPYSSCRRSQAIGPLGACSSRPLGTRSRYW